MKNISLCVDFCLHGAKEGGREGYRERVREREGKRERHGEWERVREREGKRERHGEWERDPHNFEEEASTDHLNGKGWGNTKIEWTWMNFYDLQWPSRPYLFKWSICIFIIFAFI